jgi:ABC-2 type transport system permease protein
VKTRSLVIAGREFTATVKSPGFIIATLGMPIVGALLGIIGAIPGLYLAAKEVARERGTFAFVDRSGLFGAVKSGTVAALRPPRALPAGATGTALLLARTFEHVAGAEPLSIARYPDVESATRAVKDGTVRGAVVIPEDYLASGNVAFYEDAKGGELAGRADPGATFRSMLIDELLAGVEPALRARAKQPVLERTVYRLGPDGTFALDDPLARAGKLAVPIALMIFLLLAIFTSAGYLMQGVAEEKENRVLEVILASVSARELLTGKLLGLGAAGLVQLAVWGAGIVAPAARLLPFVEVRAGVLAIGLAHFVLGYLLFGSLVLGFGSLGGNYRESQQWSATFSVAGGVLPALFLPIILDDPGGLLGRVLSIVPPTAPICMTVRAALAPVPALDLAASFGLTAAAVLIALRVSARVYRAGTLMIGKKPTFAEVWRVLRSAER